MRAIIQKLIAIGRPSKTSHAGFVLPTVTMVMLVVVLLTIAIMFRSFDRLEQARNVKVSQQALSAATPALDRAKAKIQYLLQEEPTLPRETPSDDVLYQTLANTGGSTDRYTFGDETRLTVTYDLDGDEDIIAEGKNPLQLEDNEEITTAWRYPVDTDNNGKYDSYTLYGIFFRTPPRDGTGFTRKRQPLDARTPPMPSPGVSQNQDCAGALGSSASLVGDSGWYKADGKLQKSFFVYAVTVPITDKDQQGLISGTDTNKEPENFKGTTGIAALEYQEDWERIPLTNNAVVYQDDLEISPGPAFRLNGRIITNSNLVVSPFNNPLRIYQVSGNNSCFYQAENSKIIVGGNVVNGMAFSSTDRKPVDVDLFKGKTNAVATEKISTTNQSISQGAFETIYNNQAYETRISALVTAQMAKAETDDAKEIDDKVDDRMKEEGSVDPYTEPASRRAEIRREEIELYFRNRTRKVPFAEIAANANINTALNTSGSIPTSSGDQLRPPDDWMFPTNGTATIGTADGPTKLTLKLAQLQATEPPDPAESNLPEGYLGDRILVGNNLPEKRWDDDNDTFLGEVTQKVDNDVTKWTAPANAATRTRTPRVTPLPSVGSTNRSGFWERAAAQIPEASLDGIGGLRVVTGAGVYERTNSFLPPPAVDNPATTTLDESLYDDPATTTVVEKFPIVWPDTMPMSAAPGTTVYNNASGGWIALQNPLPAAQAPAGKTQSIDPNTGQYAKGDLRMRSTVIYHYARDPINPTADPVDNQQTPIACISSYYDPTDKTTAANLTPLPNAGFGATANGKSNNGVVYPPPTNNFRPTNVTFDAATGLFTTTPVELGEQANFVFPDGRFANQPLRGALERLNGGSTDDLTLEEQAAIDSALCSLDILAGGTFAPTTTPSTGVTIAHGAIKEATFLDGRQIKAIDVDNNTTTNDETFTLSSSLTTPAILDSQYKLSLEERQPLEIRVTQLDLNQLRNQNITPDAAVTTGPTPEYLLPNSGIVYASRDDALPDRSARQPNTANNAIDEDSSKLLSPTDYKLDPTRRPNGIMLINGQYLARNDANNDGQNDNGVNSVEDVVKEKGLTLASNLPVYIQGNFNPHTQQEFTATLTADWSNFYTRTAINQNFACRPKDPRIAGCTTGDTWRPVNVLADAITLLSGSSDLKLGFRLGFRNEGDFDLRNNTGNFAAVVDDFTSDGKLDAGYDFNQDGDVTDTVDETALGFDLNGDGKTDNTAVPEANITVAGVRQINGFYANNFVTNGLSSGAFDSAADPIPVNATGTLAVPTGKTQVTDANYLSKASSSNAVNSSYFNNYVTPVQRRIKFPEYVMEICRKLPVSSCQPKDWVIGVDANSNQKFDAGEEKTSGEVSVGTAATTLLSGTTVRPALDPNDRRYPRRVAFKRYPPSNAANKYKLVLDANNAPIPLGIDASTVKEYPYTTPPPTAVNNALWFKTTDTITNPTTGDTYVDNQPLFYLKPLVVTSSTVGTVQQPLLVPVLQHSATKLTSGSSSLQNSGVNDLGKDTRWLPRAAVNTTFNLVVGSGDVPPRPTETNGGLQNLPRFLENWEGDSLITTVIGGFMQLQRSAYATAPYTSISSSDADSIFGYSKKYTINNAGGRTPFFLPPNRTWGFDVGLLSQSPDYFAQQLSGPSSGGEPNKYYREVGQDDEWVQTLLCSKIDGNNAINRSDTLDDFCENNTDY